MIRGAIFSKDQIYRLVLYRGLDPSVPLHARVVFVGLNPSTADQAVDDATVRKWWGFARRWGYDGYTAVNAFAWRATDPRDMVNAWAAGQDVVGSENDATINEVIGRAELIVPCWGASTKLPPAMRPRLAQLAARLRRTNRCKTFGFTQLGDPKHPLMLPYSTPLQPWPIRPFNH